MGIVKSGNWAVYFLVIPVVVVSTCDPATLEPEFRNGVGSSLVWGSSPSVGG